MKITLLIATLLFVTVNAAAGPASQKLKANTLSATNQYVADNGGAGDVILTQLVSNISEEAWHALLSEKMKEDMPLTKFKSGMTRLFSKSLKNTEFDDGDKSFRDALMAFYDKSMPLESQPPILQLVSCTSQALSSRGDGTCSNIDFDIDKISPSLSIFLLLNFPEIDNYGLFNKSELFNIFPEQELTALLYLDVAISNERHLTRAKDFIDIANKFELDSDLFVRTYATEMASEFDNNQIVFDEKYQGKVLYISGISDGVTKDPIDGYHIVLNTGWSLPVYGYFNNSQRLAFSKVNKGQNVTMLCLVNKNQDFIVSLNSCELAD